MSGSDGEDTLQKTKSDNLHFKALLDLIPPQFYFNFEDKQEIFGNVSDDEDLPDPKKRKKKKKPLSNLSVTQITELRQQGVTLGDKKGNGKKDNGSGHVVNGAGDKSEEYSIETKHQGKKLSRTSNSKKKVKEHQRRESRLEELKERLRAKLEEIKARKSNSAGTNTQDEKRLKRQEKKVNAKLKSKDKGDQKQQQLKAVANGLKSPPQNKILNENGVPVTSKFDFSVISFGNDRHKSSDLHGKDYKRLLERVEKQKEKVEKLKEKDPEAGKKLEQKIQWQNVINKAQGEKVKDNPELLKKAFKRKEKLKERKQKKWGERVQNVESVKQKKQDKRQANIDKRKDAKKEKKRKHLIKKGRIIPGF
ncbi:unnamed protein product [Lymnaea stagnalis]|uniref:Ribosomal RNA-processing protein 14/surfeit locus protein 6 C-terminal domain-containing protein n=1 Tax=Lymnaea stagnalis TaxID=6523 RepID=A0AAV2GZ38_LYMST